MPVSPIKKRYFIVCFDRARRGKAYVLSLWLRPEACCLCRTRSAPIPAKFALISTACMISLAADDEYVQSTSQRFAPTAAAEGFETSGLDDRRRLKIRLSGGGQRTACLEAVRH